MKPNNNLRDMYLREILIQEQSEKLYDETKQSDIKRAFIEQVLMKKGRKIILFLVKELYDCTSLEFIENINEDETIKFQITSGDITSN